MDTVRNLMAPQNAPKIYHFLPLLADAVSEDLLQLLTVVLGPEPTSRDIRYLVAIGGIADVSSGHSKCRRLTLLDRLLRVVGAMQHGTCSYPG